MFRKATPYSFPGGTSQIVNHNNARLVDVWLDEWSEFYYSFNPGSETKHKSNQSQTCFDRKQTKFKALAQTLGKIHFYLF